MLKRLRHMAWGIVSAGSMLVALWAIGSIISSLLFTWFGASDPFDDDDRNEGSCASVVFMIMVLVVGVAGQYYDRWSRWRQWQPTIADATVPGLDTQAQVDQGAS